MSLSKVKMSALSDKIDAQAELRAKEMDKKAKVKDVKVKKK